MKNFTSVADAIALERKRAELADKLAAHRARLSHDAAGNASDGNRYLSRVLEGPRALLGPGAK